MRVVSIFFRVCGRDLSWQMKISPFSREEGSGSVEKVVTTLENQDLFLKVNRAERKKAMGCQPEMLLGEHYGRNSRLVCPRLKAEGFGANITAKTGTMFAHGPADLLLYSFLSMDFRKSGEQIRKKQQNVCPRSSQGSFMGKQGRENRSNVCPRHILRGKRT